MFSSGVKRHSPITVQLSVNQMHNGFFFFGPKNILKMFTLTLGTKEVISGLSPELLGV